jgi:hypothetical protein
VEAAVELLWSCPLENVKLFQLDNDILHDFGKNVKGSSGFFRIEIHILM